MPETRITPRKVRSTAYFWIITATVVGVIAFAALLAALVVELSP